MKFFTGAPQLPSPSANKIKTTLENVCCELNSYEAYQSGLDRDTVVRMMHDVYGMVVGAEKQRIRVPAPVSNPDDSMRFVWMEGARISTRKNSSSSQRSSTIPTQLKSLDRKYTASVTSSSTARSSKSYHVGFVDDIPPLSPGQRPHPPTSYNFDNKSGVGQRSSAATQRTASAPQRQRTNSLPQRSNSVRRQSYTGNRVTIPVPVDDLPGTPLRPRKSIEDELDNSNIDYDDDGVELEDRPPAVKSRHRGGTHVGFTD